MPEALDQRFRLYSRELGAGSLNHLLLLHSVLSSSLQVSPSRVLPPPAPQGNQPSHGGRKLSLHQEPAQTALGQLSSWPGFGEVLGVP